MCVCVCVAFLSLYLISGSVTVPDLFCFLSTEHYFALLEEHRLTVLENMLRIFGSKMEEITGRLRNLYNEELHNCNFAKYLYGQMNENEICGACT